jgi:glycerol uptake operon antiterminator
MTGKEFLDCLERSPVIAAVRDDNWQKALESPVEVIFYLKANLLTVTQKVKEATAAGKKVFVHIDLADGIGKDKTGIAFLADCGVTGIISTRHQLIGFAKEKGLLTVQRFFALDSQGISSIDDLCTTGQADLFEIMPGVIPKVIQKFTLNGVPVIAGGLIDMKQEVTTALQFGATAVSTGKNELWYV